MFTLIAFNINYNVIIMKFELKDVAINRCKEWVNRSFGDRAYVFLNGNIIFDSKDINNGY